MKSLYIAILLFPFSINAQVLNGDFETWTDSLINATYSEELPAENPMWSYTMLDNFTQSGLQCRVEESYTGNYAMLCYTYYNYVAGWLSYMDYSGGRPDFLSGYYRYQLGDADYNLAQRYANVTVWSDGDTIGTAIFEFDTVASYTFFQSQIIYSSEATPDSLNVYFYTNGYGSSDIVSSFLFLDDIDLTYGMAATEKVEQSYNVYPNPATNQLYIDFESVKALRYNIFNLTGEVMASGQLLSSEIAVSVVDFPPGVYFVKISSDLGEDVVKIIIE